MIALTVIGLSGCEAKPAPEAGHHDDHDHDHDGDHHEGDGHSHEGAGHSAGDHTHTAASDIVMPKDFEAAVARIKACHASVKLALEKGELHDAHDPVDEVTIVLEKMMPLAKESGIDRSHWKEINLLVKKLGGHFDAVHEAVEQHTEGEVAVPAVEETIRRLEIIAQAPRATQQ